MAKREDPKRENREKETAAVRLDPQPPGEWHGEHDRRFVAEVCRRNLKYTFGYRYC